MLQALGDLPGRLSSALLGAGAPPVVPDEERGALAALVTRSPRGNAYLSLEPGLAIFQHPQGVVTWAAAGRTAFAVGGVHGERESTALLEAFRAHVVNRGFRQVLLFPVSERERMIVEGAQFQCLAVGSEAFVSPQEFSLSGGAKADLRQMLNRGRARYGLWSEEIAVTDADGALLEVYDSWLRARSTGHRLQLLVGTLRLDEPFGRRYFVSRDASRIHAVVTLTPGWSGEGYGIDVMARAPDAPAGAMETAITGAISQLGAEGITTLSLGACPMYEHTSLGAEDRGALRRLLRWVYRSRITGELFAFETLPRFKRKFGPTWQASYIAAWPSVGVRALYSGCRMWGLFGPRSLRLGLSRPG